MSTANLLLLLLLLLLLHPLRQQHAPTTTSHVCPAAYYHAKSNKRLDKIKLRLLPHEHMHGHRERDAHNPQGRRHTDSTTDDSPENLPRFGILSSPAAICFAVTMAHCMSWFASHV